MALRTTSIKNVKSKIIRIKTGCQWVGCLYYSENRNRAAQNIRLGSGLDIAGPAATSSNHLHSSEFLHDFFTSVNVNSTSLRCYWSECNEG